MYIYICIYTHAHKLQDKVVKIEKKKYIRKLVKRRISKSFRIIDMKF